MSSIPLGPLALPVAPLLLLATVWLAATLASRGTARQGHPERAARADAALWWAAGIGLLAARAAHLLPNVAAYAASPWSMLDLRDGGWWWPAGPVAGGAWLLWRSRSWGELRRPLLQGALAGLVLWGAGQGLLWWRSGAARPAPPVELRALDGPAFQALPALVAGQPTVVNLWTSWCAPCRAEMPDLAQAQQREPGVRFLFVNQGESAQQIRRFLQQQGLALTDVWLDPTSALGPAVGSRGLPTTVFYDARGEQVDLHFGVLNAAALRVRLAALRGR